MKSLRKRYERFCGGGILPAGNRFLYAILVTAAFVPNVALAQVTNFVFTTDPQTVESGIVSAQIAVQAQAPDGASTGLPQTGCLLLESTSSQGQFSSSATNWSPVSILTMSKNTANRSFYYKDTQGGTHTVTVKVALKPEDVTKSCTSWPTGEWNIQWTATQSITVGGSSGSSDTSTTTSQTNTTQQTQTTTTTTTTSNPVSSYVTPPEIQIFADGGDDRTVIVGADTEFYGRAYNRDKEELARVRFSWNFGDGSTAEGITVLHHFDYPGRYAVVLNIAEHRSAASDVIVVEAEPAQLSFGIGADGSVSIGNEAGRDLDLSRWVVRSFGREFVLPEHSIILKGAVTHILQKTLGFPAGLQTELAYPNGVVALRAGEDTLKAAPPVTTAPAAPLAVIPPPVLPTRPVSFDAPPEMPEQTAEVEAVEEATSSQVAASAALVGGGRRWWLGVLALSFASTGAVYLARHYARKEWNIIEESPK